MSGARGWALRCAARAAAGAAAVAALALVAACGKKGPLRLPDERPPERADTPRASVREGRLNLVLRVPPHRVFPEREEPWVLARILRRDGPGKDYREVGSLLERGGFAFDSRLAWNEEARTVGASSYQVEFRDAARRRRALSEPLEVLWQPPPAAPAGLVASGDDRAVSLTWVAPPGSPEGMRYRVYRREPPEGRIEVLTAEPLAVPGHTDSRVKVSREYCYQVRAVLGAPLLEVEGPPSAEACVSTDDATPPPPPVSLRVTAADSGRQLAWDEVAAGDLLGYRVYRAVDDGPFELLTPVPVRGNAYRDEAGALPVGARLRYVVTAVDTSARQNESAFSPVSEVPAVPPPQTR